MDKLKIVETFGSNYALIELTGVINSYTCGELKQKVLSLVLDTNVVLDLSKVEAIDSSGIGIIMAAFNDAEDSGLKLYMMNPSIPVKQAVEDTGFSDTFYFIRSVTEVV